MNLNCVFYAEFDLKAGPIIVYQYPQSYIHSETFKAIKHFIIPSKALCGLFTIINLPPNLAIVCLPAELTRAKYHRGSFEFNVGLVFSQD